MPCAPPVLLGDHMTKQYIRHSLHFNTRKCILLCKLWFTLSTLNAVSKFPSYKQCGHLIELIRSFCPECPVHSARSHQLSIRRRVPFAVSPTASRWPSWRPRAVAQARAPTQRPVRSALEATLRRLVAGHTRGLCGGWREHIWLTGLSGDASGLHLIPPGIEVSALSGG